MSMPTTPSPADTRAAFEAWAQERYRSNAYLHTNACTGDYDAYLAGRAAALEEAAQIADAEAARLEQAAQQADPDDVSAIRSKAWALENIAWKIRERAKT